MAYTSDNSSNALLEHFVIFHHLLHDLFGGDEKSLAPVLQDLEILILSSNKKLKSSEQAIVNSLFKYEEGFDEESTARNQLREVLSNFFVNNNNSPIIISVRWIGRVIEFICSCTTEH